MMEVIFTVGVSGCGKTTWALAQKGFTVVSRDDFRKEIYEETHDFEFHWAGWKWKDEDEVTRRVDAKLDSLTRQNKDIIIADTNLNKQRLESMQKRFESIGYDTTIKYFHGHLSTEDVSIEKCITRDASRKLSVGALVINKQWKQMMDSYGATIRRQYTPRQDMPSAIIVDIDGTVADHKGVRGPFEWDKVDLDKPIRHVIDLVRLVANSGVHVIFVSGRDGVCAGKTYNWVNANVLRFPEIYMRSPGDIRSDDIVKEELFFDHIDGKYNILYVIDDRKKMVQRWHDIGLSVVNVGHINEYF